MQEKVPGELDRILFVSGSNTQPILGAALMDIATLVALLWVRWPSVDLVGALADWALSEGYIWRQLGTAFGSRVT